MAEASGLICETLTAHKCCGRGSDGEEAGAVQWWLARIAAIEELATIYGIEKSFFSSKF